MTTAPVTSITDEMIDQLLIDSAQWATKEEIEGLIARLRAAEADAKRYRWLRDKSVDADGVYPMVSLTDECGDQVSNWLFGRAVDKAVDEAMERKA